MLALGTVGAQPGVTAYGLISNTPEDPLSDLDSHELFPAHLNPLTGECTKVSEFDSLPTLYETFTKN